jgi:hypothetical protein
VCSTDLPESLRVLAERPVADVVLDQVIPLADVVAKGLRPLAEGPSCAPGPAGSPPLIR